MESSERDVVERLVRWAGSDAQVRALLLTSSRANPTAPLDHLSDYDILVIVSGVRPLDEDESWLREYGTPLVHFRNAWTRHGVEGITRLVLYDDGVKIDYQVWPVELLDILRAQPTLPDNLDVGYRVLVDKDLLTQDLKPATYTAHIPPAPSAAEYHALVEEFWWESTYVAKNLWRDELFPAKYSLDAVMKFDLLRRMLEWFIEIDHDWSIAPGSEGKRLKRRLSPEIWTQVERTFVGADPEENWEALFTALTLFRTLAIAVGASLGYEYPEEMDRRMTAYLSRIRETPR
jgi:aminoglycoside 6-adenylyltransferase